VLLSLFGGSALEEDNYSFGYWVQRQRKALDLTRAELASRVHCSTAMIKKIERDERRPSLHIAELLADAFYLHPELRTSFLQAARGQLSVDQLPLPFQPRGQIRDAIRGYELGDQIGKGDVGIIYKAWQPSVGREVAVKIILPQFANHPDFIRRFEVEARTIALLEHPHVTPLYDFWREPYGAYLVMRWMRGGNLRSHLEYGPVELERAVKWIFQICSGLATAHDKGIIHGDLKPENLLFDEDGNIYLTDFGNTLRVERGTSDSEAVNSPSPVYSSPEHLLNEPLTPKSDLYCLGVLLFEMLTGQPPFKARSIHHGERQLPLLQSFGHHLPPFLDKYLQKAVSWDPHERFPDASSMSAALQEAVVGRVWEPIISSKIQLMKNPYKGLRPFEEADEGFFFGREAFIELLLRRLSSATRKNGDGQENRGHGRFLAVVGPSGSGKSSVIRAGLLPALRNGQLTGAGKWFIVEMNPGSDPLKGLEAALLRVAADTPGNLLAQMSEDENGILNVVNRVLPADLQVELLLFIDQFEELFTLVEDPDTVKSFLNGLFVAVSATNSRLRIVLTLRADFYDRPLSYPSFGELMRGNTEVVLPLDAKELAEAIRKPAEQVGVTFEDGLVQSIVAEVSAQPGALPLMQYALTELFDNHQGRILTYEAYQETGGVFGAVSRSAEDLYSRLSPGSQEIARQLFLRLVTLGEGVEDTRRRVKVSELESLATLTPGVEVSASPQQVQIVRVVLEAFGKARLVSFDREPQTRSPTVEIAHEALLREWGRLKNWLNKNRVDVRLQRALGYAASEWNSSGRDPSFLLRGARLEQFEAWAAETSMALNKDERHYLKASLSARNARHKAEQARQKREAVLERRSRNFLRVLVMVLSLAVLASLGFAGTAKRQASLATARELALAASLNLPADPELSIMLALRSLETAYTPAGEEVLRHALHSSRVRFSIEGASAFTSLAYSPEGDRMATMNQSGWVQVWDAQNGDELSSRHLGEAGGYIAYSPDGARLAAGISDGRIMILDALSTEMIFPPLSGHSSWFNEIAFSPDGNLLASASYDGTIRIWDMYTGEAKFILVAPAGEFPGGNNLAFSPGNEYLLVTDRSSSSRMIDLETGEELSPIPTKPSIGRISRYLAVDNDDIWLATKSGSVEEIAEIWDFTSLLEGRSEQPLFRLMGHINTINSIDFSPHGRLLATGSSDSTIKIWRLSPDGGQELMTLSGQRGHIGIVRFSPDGSTLASVSFDGTLRVWDINPEGSREVLTLARHEDAIRSIAFSPSNDHLASASFDGTVHIWDWKTGELIHNLDQHYGQVYAVGFSPDGKYLATGGEDFTLRVWEVDSGQNLMALVGHDLVRGEGAEYKVGGLFPGILAVAFSPDGRLIASIGSDATLRFWEVETGALTRVLEVHPDKNGGASLAFSPDGMRIATGTDEAGPGKAGSGQVRGIIWDVVNGNSLITISDLPRRIWGIHFSPDGEQIAFAGFGGFLSIRDAGNGEELFSLAGHSSTIISVAYSPDGSILVSAGVEPPKIWDIESRQVLFSLPGHSGYVSSVAFNSDGTRLATAGQDRTVRIYTTDLDELKAIAANRLTRWFTPDECSQYLHSNTCPALND
jgi:WD40 repeat protein/serine/threonine protein kinase/DNA-binding XRE family transcriptional regulator